MMAEDVECLSDPDLNGSRSLFGKEGLVIENLAPYELDDEDEIRLGKWLFKVIANPFSHEGKLLLLLNPKAFFFRGHLVSSRVGRTDLPGGCEKCPNPSREISAFCLFHESLSGHGEA
jgi:hypothetical protein